MSTSLQSLIDDVYTLTNRPDLVAETSLAVRSATLKLHSLDNWYKDIYQTGIQWNPVDYIQSLEYRTLVPRYRKFKYLRKYSPPTGNDMMGYDGDFFTLITPDNTLDDYGINRENVCYVAGAYINIRSNTQDQYMIFGCYIQPDITELGFSSWIADEYPFAIVTEAASKVFKTIGYDEQFQAMLLEARDWRQILIQEATAGGE